MADFTAFFDRPPDQAGAEDLRRYQVHMRSAGASPTTMNAAVSALRFFFGVTLGRADAQTGMTTVRESRRQSVIRGLAPVRMQPCSCRIADHKITRFDELLR